MSHIHWEIIHGAFLWNAVFLVRRFAVNKQSEDIFFFWLPTNSPTLHKNKYQIQQQTEKKSCKLCHFRRAGDRKQLADLININDAFQNHQAKRLVEFLFFWRLKLLFYPGRTFQCRKVGRKEKQDFQKCHPTGVTCPQKASSIHKTSFLKVYFERESNFSFLFFFNLWRQKKKRKMTVWWRESGGGRAVSSFEACTYMTQLWFLPVTSHARRRHNFE